MNRPSRCLLVLLSAGWMALMAPMALLAQQDASFAGFQLNRSLPGARSLAMGGAFVALADDATAAYSNPAGLTLLSRREVSLEGRDWSSQNPFTERGRISGTPSGVGIDTFSGLARGETSDRKNGISFVSYVETAPERPWAFALYRHTLVDFSTRFASQRVFSDGGVPRFGPFRFTTRFEVFDTGVAYSHQFGRCIQASGCLRLGIGLARYDLKLHTLEDVLADPDGNGAADLGASSIAAVRTDGDDAKLAGNLGLIWETAHSWRFAVAYRQGPDFAIRQKIFTADIRPARFHLPDQLVAGAAFQPTSAFTISAELDRIRYSSLLRGNSLASFDLHDGTEARLGTEYVFFVGDPIKPTRLALMAGAWSDPDHRISFSAPVVVSGDLFRNAFFPQGGKRRGHVSAGLGANFGNFQVDAGCDRSADISTCGLSTVARF